METGLKCCTISSEGGRYEWRMHNKKIRQAYIGTKKSTSFGWESDIHEI